MKFKIYSKNKLFFISILFVVYWIINSTSCTFLNEEELFKDIECDTINVSYSDLTYIFTGICTNCHNEVFSYRDGIMMDSYIRVKSSINTGLVLPAINHAEGVPRMPNGMPKLSTCELDKIKAWINAGMVENK